jgi:hypothetical protein
MIERRRCYGFVTRRAYSSSSGSIWGGLTGPGPSQHASFGGSTSSSGTTSWQERVPVIRVRRELLYSCKHCAARWSEVQVEEFEDFDIDRP